MRIAKGVNEGFLVAFAQPRRSPVDRLTPGQMYLLWDFANRSIGAKRKGKICKYSWKVKSLEVSIEHTLGYRLSKEDLGVPILKDLKATSSLRSKGWENCPSLAAGMKANFTLKKEGLTTVALPESGAVLCFPTRLNLGRTTLSYKLYQGASQYLLSPHRGVAIHVHKLNLMNFVPEKMQVKPVALALALIANLINSRTRLGPCGERLSPVQSEMLLRIIRSPEDSEILQTAKRWKPGERLKLSRRVAKLLIEEILGDSHLLTNPQVESMAEAVRTALASGLPEGRLQALTMALYARQTEKPTWGKGETIRVAQKSTRPFVEPESSSSPLEINYAIENPEQWNIPGAKSAYVKDGHLHLEVWNKPGAPRRLFLVPVADVDALEKGGRIVLEHGSSGLDDYAADYPDFILKKASKHGQLSITGMQRYQLCADPHSFRPKRDPSIMVDLETGEVTTRPIDPSANLDGSTTQEAWSDSCPGVDNYRSPKVRFAIRNVRKKGE